MTKILIAGSAGFVGTTISGYMLQHTDFDIVGIDNLSVNKDLYNVEAMKAKRRCEFYIADVIYTDVFDKILHVENPDVVIFAIDAAGSKRKELFRAFVQSCNKIGVQQLISISSEENHLADYAKTEGSIAEEINTYSKLIDLTDIRCCRLFGPRQDVSRFMPKVIYNALDLYHGFDLSEIKSEDQTKYEWLYIQDFFKALLDVIKYKLIGRIVISSQQIATEAQIIQYILSIVNGSYIDPEILSERLITDNLLNTGWEPSYGLEQAIEHTVVWYNQNTWVRRRGC